MQRLARVPLIGLRRMDNQAPRSKAGPQYRNREVAEVHRDRQVVLLGNAAGYCRHLSKARLPSFRSRHGKRLSGREAAKQTYRTIADPTNTFDAQSQRQIPSHKAFLTA